MTFLSYLSLSPVSYIWDTHNCTNYPELPDHSKRTSTAASHNYMSDWLTCDAWIHAFQKSYWGFRWDFVKWRLVSSEDTNIWLHAAMHTHTHTHSPYGLWWTGRYTDKMSFNRVFRAATLQIKVGYITSYRHMPQLWPGKTSVYFLPLQSVYLFSFQSFFVSVLSSALHLNHWTGPAFHLPAVSTTTEAELVAATVLPFVQWIIS